MSPPVPPDAEIDDIAVEAAPHLWRRSARFIPVAVIVAGLVLIFATGLNRYLTLDALQERQAILLAYVAVHPVQSVVLYATAYMVMVAFSVPGAMIMTMAGGFLFGTALGSASAVVGMTLGAIIMFAAARTALGEVMRKKVKAGGLIERITHGVQSNAFSYLLVLRLLPAIPFWLCNIAAGFVAIPFRTYVIATILGIIPSTVIYSSIGAGLGHVFARGDKPDLNMMMEPQVLLPLIGLALLCVLPLAYHAWKLRRRRGLAETP